MYLFRTLLLCLCNFPPYESFFPLKIKSRKFPLRFSLQVGHRQVTWIPPGTFTTFTTFNWCEALIHDKTEEGSRLCTTHPFGRNRLSSKHSFCWWEWAMAKEFCLINSLSCIICLYFPLHVLKFAVHIYIISSLRIFSNFLPPKAMSSPRFPRTCFSKCVLNEHGGAC